MIFIQIHCLVDNFRPEQKLGPRQILDVTTSADVATIETSKLLSVLSSSTDRLAEVMTANTDKLAAALASSTGRIAGGGALVSLLGLVSCNKLAIL